MPIFPGRLILWLRINTDEQTEGEDVLAAEGEIEMSEDPLHTVVSWRKVAAGFPTVLRAVPNDSLGGVLNFKKKQQKERWTLGEGRKPISSFASTARSWNPSRRGARIPE